MCGTLKKTVIQSNPKDSHSQFNSPSFYQYFTCTTDTRVSSWHFSTPVAEVAEEMERTQGKKQGHERHRTEWKFIGRSLQLEWKRSEADRSKGREQTNTYIQLQGPSTYSEVVQHAIDIVQHMRHRGPKKEALRGYWHLVFSISNDPSTLYATA